MPFYVPGNDPGTDFVGLLRGNGLDPFPKDLPGTIDAGRATTLALRCAGGSWSQVTAGYLGASH